MYLLFLLLYHSFITNIEHSKLYRICSATNPRSKIVKTNTVIYIYIYIYIYVFRGCRSYTGDK